jgi:glutathione S-transferase
MHLQAALISLLTVVVIAVAMMLVGRARGMHKVQVPATTGHPDFERAFRAHQNTLEQTVMFLPVLWVATIYRNEQTAAWLGYAWLVGRSWYLFGYIGTADGRGRSGGFLISFVALVGLLVMGLWGVLPKLVA